MIRQILLPVLAPSVLFAVGTGATLPVLVVAALELGATAGQASLIVALQGLVSLLLTVPAGQLIDRIGDRAAMLTATGAAVVVSAAIVVTLSLDPVAALPIYAACLMLMAPIQNMWGLARQALVAETVDPADVGRAMTLLGGSMRVGRLLGPLLSAALLLVFPLWTPFVAAAVSALLAVGILFLPGARSFGGATGRRNTGAPRVKVSRLDVRWPAVFLAGVSVTILAMLRALNPIIVPLVGVEIGVSASTIAVLIAVGALVEISLIVPGGFLKDRLGRVATMVVCLLIFGGGFLMLGAPGRLGLLVVAVLVMGVGNGLGSGVNMTIGADLSPSQGRPTFLGVWAIFNNAGSFTGPLAASALIAVAGIGAASLATGVIGLAGAAWMLGWARVMGLPGRQSG